MTERASPSPESRHAAISWLFGRAMLSLRLLFFVSVLALSVTFGDSSPKGGATGVSVSFRLDAESPTGRKSAGLATEGRLPFVQPLSLTSFDSSPSRGASGEEAKLYGMPRPPLARGGGIASAMTERLDYRQLQPA